VVRLPAEDDPLWKRVEKIGERNRVFYNALDASYEPFYKSLWQPYLDWRRYNLVEQLSIRQARSDGLRQAAAGIIMIAAAILLEVNDVNNSSTIRDVLVLGGTQVIINGINISKAADIHRETLQELADSFGSDAKSVQVTLEGQTVTLTGSVREQMEQWKDLLRKMHEKEFDVPVEGP
jgi:osmotically-inducible protein OsmY